MRRTGDWETWLTFFLEGVEQTSAQAVDTAQRILLLFEADRAKLRALGRKAGGNGDSESCFAISPFLWCGVYQS